MLNYNSIHLFSKFLFLSFISFTVPLFLSTSSYRSFLLSSFCPHLSTPFSPLLKHLLKNFLCILWLNTKPFQNLSSSLPPHFSLQLLTVLSSLPIPFFISSSNHLPLLTHPPITFYLFSSLTFPSFLFFSSIQLFLLSFSLYLSSLFPPLIHLFLFLLHSFHFSKQAFSLNPPPATFLPYYTTLLVLWIIITLIFFLLPIKREENCSNQNM